MTLAVLKQNAEILLEVSQNYEMLLEKRKSLSKEESQKYDLHIKNFKKSENSAKKFTLIEIHKLAPATLLRQTPSKISLNKILDLCYSSAQLAIEVKDCSVSADLRQKK